MNEGMNKVILLGNLGADPELRYTGAGIPVLNVRLATNETWVDKGHEIQERTEWHNVVFWGARAEGLSRVLGKGDCLYIEGSLRTTSYEKEGQKRYRTEVIAKELRFTARRVPHAADEAGAPASPPATERYGRNGVKPRLDAPPAPVEEPLEEMPF
jgi:single-strand DNA-binding protein